MEFVRHKRYDGAEIMHRMCKHFRTKLNRKTINKVALFGAFRKLANMWEGRHRVRCSNSSIEQQHFGQRQCIIIGPNRRRYREGDVILFCQISEIVFSLRFLFLLLAFHFMGPQEFL